jgi:SHS2 domain-containing protein
MTKKNKIIIHSDDNKENIELALLEAIWTMRWTENKEAMYAVLTVEEAQQIMKDIFIELDKIGYEIKKK